MNATDDIAVAEAVLAGVKELLDLYESHKQGVVSAQTVLDAIQPFNDRIAQNKAAALKALDAKFPPSGG